VSLTITVRSPRFFIDSILYVSLFPDSQRRNSTHAVGTGPGSLTA
jgi:hypothetical protein